MIFISPTWSGVEADPVDFEDRRAQAAAAGEVVELDVEVAGGHVLDVAPARVGAAGQAEPLHAVDVADETGRGPLEREVVPLRHVDRAVLAVLLLVRRAV